MVFNYDVSDLLERLNTTDSTVSDLGTELNGVESSLETAESSLANIDIANVQSITVAGENLDAYTSGGIYYFGASAEPVGKPTGTSSFGFLVVVNGGNNARLVQYWINSATDFNTMWMRSSSAVSLLWGDWKRFTNNEDLESKEITPTIVSTLPTGITAVSKVIVVQSGNVVSVSLDITRNSSSLTSYQVIASGLPVPKVRPISGSVSIPLGQISAASSTAGRPLNAIVNASGNLAVSSGGVAAQYLGTFTYITDEI